MSFAINMDEVRREAEKGAVKKPQSAQSAPSNKKAVRGEEWIFGIPKNGPEVTKAASENKRIEPLLDMLNKEIVENGYSDFHKAFLKENMFKSMREDVREHQGR